MLDPNFYVTALFKTPYIQHEECIVWIDTLARLAQTKKQLIWRTDQTTLNRILQGLQCPKIIQELVQALATNNDLKLLPRLAKAYRRRLIQAGIPYVEVTCADASSMDGQIRAVFGASSVIVHHIDSQLIAGVRIAGADGTYEYSVESQLQKLKRVLTE